MISFLEFLAEDVLKDLLSRDMGETYPVYINPGPTEMAEIGTQVASWNLPNEFLPYGSPCLYQGAFFTKRNMIVFDRRAFMHGDVRRGITGIPNDALPVYCYYFPTRRLVGLEVSSASKTHFNYQRNDLEWLKMLAKHPALTAFHLVVRNPEYSATAKTKQPKVFELK